MVRLEFREAIQVDKMALNMEALISQDCQLEGHLL